MLYKSPLLYAGITQENCSLFLSPQTFFCASDESHLTGGHVFQLSVLSATSQIFTNFLTFSSYFVFHEQTFHVEIAIYAELSVFDDERCNLAM